MDILSPVSGEVSDSKVAAVFDSEHHARAVARQVEQEAGLEHSQVQVVTPATRRPGARLEPEDRGIFRTNIVAHYRLGIAGLVLGALAFAALYLAGFRAVVASPGFAAAVITGFGGIAGLMLGGLVSLRPDHTPYLARVAAALGEGRCAVVVHAFDTEQRDRAERVLAAAGGQTVRTL